MSDRLHITVMLGGPSAEREVSLQSGAAVVKALRSLGHTVDPLDPRDDSWALAAGTEVVFLALHGTYGEDGTVQRHLEALGLPYTGCDSEASRIAFDKVMTKKRCVQAGVPTARFVVVTSPNAKARSSPASRSSKRSGASTRTLTPARSTTSSSAFAATSKTIPPTRGTWSPSAASVTAFLRTPEPQLV